MNYNYAPKTAMAEINGGPLAPQIKGQVFFEEVNGGTMITVYVTGLPNYQPGENPIGPHGFHIHQFGDCTIGDQNNPFQQAGEHWNPTNQPHGNHAGDLPVLFSNNGVAYMDVFTNKFTVDEVVGKAVIIHENPDDYRTQPAGNAGRRLACGIVRRLN